MNEIAEYPMNEMERAGVYIAKSGLFGVKTVDQAIALMLVAKSEGRNPFEAARDYHIIQNRPALKADAILSRFQQAGGKVEWVEYTDTKVVGKFMHPQGGSVTVDWTMDRAKQAGLTGKDNWRNYPRAMLRARCISEGVHTVFPGVAAGIYTVEEVQDMGNQPLAPEMEVVMPEQARPAAEQETVIAKTEDEYRAEAKRIAEDLVLSDARVKELWRDSAHDYPAFIALLKAEPQGMMF